MVVTETVAGVLNGILMPQKRQNNNNLVFLRSVQVHIILLILLTYLILDQA